MVALFWVRFGAVRIRREIRVERSVAPVMSPGPSEDQTAQTALGRSGEADASPY
jgi:hypothetical protein